MMWEKTTITVFDRNDGWRVRFEPFISMYDGNEYMGVTVWHEGKKVMHSGHTNYKATEQSADEIVKHVKAISEQLEDK